MKGMLLTMPLIGCLIWYGCVNSASTGLSNNLNSTPAASPEPQPAPSTSAELQQSKRAKVNEQTVFGMEEKVENPINIPEDVLRILRRDEDKPGCLSEAQSSGAIPASWFAASEIHLNDDNSPDLIATVANPCLSGANVNPFWVFRKTPQGHRLVLHIGAYNLFILQTKTLGYRDIKTEAVTAKEILTTIYKFNGKNYMARRFKREPIGE